MPEKPAAGTYGTSDRFEFRMKWTNGYTEVHTENITTGQSATQQASFRTALS